MPNGSNLELSKDGVKISYRRFLTDTTPGFILILFLIWARTYTGQAGFLTNHVRHLISSGSISTDLKPLVLVILFLLALPMGVLINVAGWLFLEWFQKILELFLCNYRWCFYWFKKEYDFDGCRRRLDIAKNNWFEKVRTAEIALVNDFPDKSDAIEAVRGIAILSRNLSLMSLVAVFCFKETKFDCTNMFCFL